MFSCFQDKSFLKRFMHIALPVMISSFVTFLVTFIDNIMVSTVSEDAVGGVYAANQVSYIINLGIFGILEGAGIFIQQYMGAKDEKKLREAFGYKMVAMGIFGIVTIPLVCLFSNNLIWLFCKEDENALLIFEEAKTYMKLIIISYIPYMIGYIYSSTLREIGETKHAMYSSLVAIFTNTILNAVFIIGCKWGVMGAALATIIARVFEMLYLIFICYFKKFSFCRFHLKDIHISKEVFIHVTQKGWLLFINEIGFGVGNVLQSMAFSQRNGVLAAISVVTTISNIFFILINGLSVSIGVMVGSSLGAQEFDKAKDEAKKLNLLGFYMALLVGFILIILSPVIPYVFKEVSIEQKALATKLIIIYGATLFANCLSVTFYFVLRAGGKTLMTFFFDTGMMILCYVPLAWILAYFTKLDMVYIYLFVRLIDIPKMLLGLLFVKSETWMNNLTLETI